MHASRIYDWLLGVRKVMLCGREICNSRRESSRKNEILILNFFIHQEAKMCISMRDAFSYAKSPPIRILLSAPSYSGTGYCVNFPAYCNNNELRRLQTDAFKEVKAPNSCFFVLFSSRVKREYLILGCVICNPHTLKTHSVWNKEQSWIGEGCTSSNDVLHLKAERESLKHVIKGSEDAEEHFVVVLICSEEYKKYTFSFSSETLNEIRRSVQGKIYALIYAPCLMNPSRWKCYFCMITLNQDATHALPLRVSSFHFL